MPDSEKEQPIEVIESQLVTPLQGFQKVTWKGPVTRVPSGPRVYIDNRPKEDQETQLGPDEQS